MADLEQISFLFNINAPMCFRFVFAKNLEGEVNGLRHVLAFCRWQRDLDWATCSWQSVVEWVKHSAMERDMQS
jgi:hypothetical protein